MALSWRPTLLQIYMRWNESEKMADGLLSRDVRQLFTRDGHLRNFRAGLIFLVKRISKQRMRCVVQCCEAGRGAPELAMVLRV